MPERAFITGLAGPRLTPAERSFLRDAEPWGIILFKHNIVTPEQVIVLIDSCREIMGRRAPVLVDQEGGRVQRLGPPYWPLYPPGAVYGQLYEQSPAKGRTAAYLGARLIAEDLHRLGIDVNCLPVADIPVAGADPVIGDRAYGETPEKVTALAKAVADGLLAGGVLPVLKHMPGHGRATADSHRELPIVTADWATLEATDFQPFHQLADLPLGMTAHIVFTAIDPDAPATLSRAMIELIRSEIGFNGVLMSDDIGMGALHGSLRSRVTAAFAAGCDVVLHCSGDLAEMEDVAAVTPLMGGEAAQRAEAALAARRIPKPIDPAAARAVFSDMLAAATSAAG